MTLSLSLFSLSPPSELALSPPPLAHHEHKPASPFNVLFLVGSLPFEMGSQKAPPMVDHAGGVADRVVAWQVQPQALRIGQWCGGSFKASAMGQQGRSTTRWREGAAASLGPNGDGTNMSRGLPHLDLK